MIDFGPMIERRRSQPIPTSSFTLKLPYKAAVLLRELAEQNGCAAADIARDGIFAELRRRLEATVADNAPKAA